MGAMEFVLRGKHLLGLYSAKIKKYIYVKNVIQYQYEFCIIQQGYFYFIVLETF